LTFADVICSSLRYSEQLHLTSLFGTSTPYHYRRVLHFSIQQQMEIN
jgi:hypothetical protein